MRAISRHIARNEPYPPTKGSSATKRYGYSRCQQTGRPTPNSLCLLDQELPHRLEFLVSQV